MREVEPFLGQPLSVRVEGRLGCRPINLLFRQDEGLGPPVSKSETNLDDCGATSPVGPWGCRWEGLAGFGRGLDGAVPEGLKV